MKFVRQNQQHTHVHLNEDIKTHQEIREQNMQSEKTERQTDKEHHLAG